MTRADTVEPMKSPHARPEEIAGTLHREIMQRTGYRAPDLSVTAQDGRVLVHGRVKTYYVKQLVLAAVMKALDQTDLEADFELDVVS